MNDQRAVLSQKIESHRDLRVWQLAMDLAERVYGYPHDSRVTKLTDWLCS
jgi:hypothetical protein